MLNVPMVMLDALAAAWLMTIVEGMGAGGVVVLVELGAMVVVVVEGGGGATNASLTFL